MKKSKLIILFTSIILFILTAYAYASNSQIVVNGDSVAKLGETKEIVVKLSSNETIGVVSGKIEKNDNITSIAVKGKNNWNLTYNNENGVFNLYKAEGAKDEEIISIEYVAGNTEGTGKITLSNIKLTSIDYETKEVENIEKEIEIKTESAEVQENNAEENTETPEADAEKENPEETKIEEQIQVNKNDTSVSDKIIPKTGKIDYIAISIIIIMVIIASIFYIKYKQYKKI